MLYEGILNRKEGTPAWTEMSTVKHSVRFVLNMVLRVVQRCLRMDAKVRYPASFLARCQLPSILPFRASFAQLQLISQDSSPSHLPRLCSSKVLALDEPGPTSEKPFAERICARLSDIFH